MNKAILTLIVSSLLLSACGATPQLNNSSTTTPSANSPTEVANKPISQSLRDLIGLGSTQKCTWSSTDNADQPMTGELLIKGKQFKQISNVIVEGKAVVSTMISDGTNFYTWTDLTKNAGIKMALPTSDPTNPAKDENLDKKYDYNCTPSTASDADFTVPTDIKFTDLSNTLDKLKDLKNQFKDLIPTE